MSYLGNSPDNQTFLSGTDYFSGNGSTVLFTLSRQVISVNDIIVVVENVVQYPGVAYSVIGNQLTFTGAPQSGTNNIYVRYMSVNTRSIGVSDGAITTPKIQNGSITKSKLDIVNSDGSGAMELPSGTTAQRPSNPTGNMIRKNTTTGYIEYYDTSSSSWIGLGSFQASGGSEATYNSGGTTYKVHTFTTSGIFQVLSGAKNVQYLVIAGGGGGGFGYYGGGGGAGGYRSSVIGESSGGGASAEGTLNITSGNYIVTIGAGGAGSTITTSRGANGGDSVFASITSTGGGGGGSRNNDAAGTPSNGSNGGAGGGGSFPTSTGGSGTSGQGYKGSTVSGSSYGGGGGGAAAAATDGSTALGTYADGGSGVQSSITGTAVYRAGGGGGGGNAGAYAVGAAGNGGGGAGGNVSGSASTAGTANTGGGGGGQGTNTSGSAGGSGVVIIRYVV